MVKEPADNVFVLFWFARARGIYQPAARQDELSAATPGSSDRAFTCIGVR